jgi:hypothetical protein
VFITSPSDYIRFRAEYIMPNVMLDMAAVQLDERERSRQLRRAS